MSSEGQGRAPGPACCAAAREGIRRGLLQVIAAVAPEVDLAAIEPGRPLREQLDLDSLDWLMVLLGVHDRFSIDIVELGAAWPGTLEQLEERCAGLPGGAPSPPPGPARAPREPGLDGRWPEVSAGRAC